MTSNELATTETSNPRELKDAARRYLELGLNVTVAQGKDPSCMGREWHRQKRDLGTIERLIDSSPSPTVGLQAGPFTDSKTKVEHLLVMVDVDSTGELEAAKELLGGNIPPCWWAETGRGHRLLFRVAPGNAPPGRASIHYKGTNGAKVLVQFGSDGRAAHSVVPPSLHYEKTASGRWEPSGRCYVWKGGFSPDSLPLQEFPAEAAGKLTELEKTHLELKRIAEARLEGVERSEGDPLTGVHQRALEAMLLATKDMGDVTDGSKRLFACACRAAEYYLTDDCFLATLDEYEEHSAPFLGEFRPADRVDRLRQAEGRSDVTVGGALVELMFDKLVPAEHYSLTDDGNADRLIDLADGGIKYLVDSQRWMTWRPDESRWRVEVADHAIVNIARKGLKELVLNELERRLQAGDHDDFDDPVKLEKAYRGFAKSSANVTRVQNAVKFAKSAPAMHVRVEQLDSDPYLLGTPGGVVDLRTGELKPARRSDLITNSTAARVGDASAAKRWLRFLEETFLGDEEVIRFMARLLGMTLIGEQREQVLPVWYGKGANGKSVLIDTVSTVLGDYAAPMPDGLLTSSKWDKHPTEIASLVGLRLCFAEETSDRAELDEAKVKRLTGGSELRARFMHKDFFTFTPSHTPVLVTNYKPAIHGMDEGIWRRIKVVDFGHTVPRDLRDPDLKTKLLGERADILAWLIAGCVEYLAHGLGEPARVTAQTEEYQRQTDSFKQFDHENIERQPGAFLATADIEARCATWADGTDCFGVPNLTRRLAEEYGDLRTNSGGKRGYRGLALKPETSYATGA